MADHDGQPGARRGIRALREGLGSPASTASATAEQRARTRSATRPTALRPAGPGRVLDRVAGPDLGVRSALPSARRTVPAGPSRRCTSRPVSRLSGAAVWAARLRSEETMRSGRSAASSRAARSACAWPSSSSGMSAGPGSGARRSTPSGRAATGPAGPAATARSGRRSRGHARSGSWIVGQSFQSRSSA